MKLRIENVNQRGVEYPAWIAICLALGAKTYVEVGCGVGLGLNYARSAGMGKTVGIDLCPHPPATWHEGRPGDETNMGYVAGDSSSDEVIQKTVEFLCGHPDVVFIDADHSYGKSRKDFEKWWPFVKLAVGFHDVLMDHPDSVGIFWKEISLVHRSLELYSRDRKSIMDWQGQGAYDAAKDGRMTAAGIGILFKE